VQGLRAKAGGSARENLVQGLLQEFSLSSDEGVALMCLAEALLRIPDAATRDALIRDKIGRGDWRAHLGASNSPFINAATWGLLVTGKLVATHDERGLGNALTRVTARVGEPVIRKAVDLGMRLMGKQFVAGETVADALENAKLFEALGFTYSYDMLGEAAMTAADAERYYRSYQDAIHAIGRVAAGRGIHDGPGISVKLSALHPRYSFAQRERILAELYPKAKALMLLARRYDVSLNIDAEEADRVELSLDLLEGLCAEPELAGWNGIGYVAQAYGKRCPALIDHLVDLARRTQRRLMVRLVKGAYWDAEVKRAQVDGLEDYPVYTRKVHSDVSYLACARKLLAAPTEIYPQFATHNAQSLAAIYHMAGAWSPGQYEFQCLHGMGEPLYSQVVGRRRGQARAPVPHLRAGRHARDAARLPGAAPARERGQHSFINRIADPAVPLEDLVASPVAVVRATAAWRARRACRIRSIPLPRALFGACAPTRAAWTSPTRVRSRTWPGPARLGGRVLGAEPTRRARGDNRGGAPVRNPAAPTTWWATSSRRTPTTSRSRCSSAGRVPHGSNARGRARGSARARRRCAGGADAPPHGPHRARGRQDLFERGRESARGGRLPALLRRAGARAPGCRDASCAGSGGLHQPLELPARDLRRPGERGPGRGQHVLAKPAEQTPLIAAEAVRLMHEAGVPQEVLLLLPGRGETVGARLVADPRVRGVVFTGSTEVARIIQRTLAGRLDPQGHPIPLVAETGGQNAMIADSSALPEQVVADAVVSAFDSAGQRCSALRVLCVQEDVADRILEMLHGAVAELVVGNPERLAVDVGPVIDAAARDALLAYIEKMRGRGLRVHQPAIRGDAEAGAGTFRAPDRHRARAHRRARARGLRPGAARAALSARGAARAPGGDRGPGIRPHDGHPFARGRDHRRHRRLGARRQHLREPQHRGRGGGGAALRRRRTLGHRPQGRRPALPLSPAGRVSAGCRHRGAARLDEPGVRAALRTYQPTLRAFEALRQWSRGAFPELAAACDRLAAFSPAGAKVVLPGPTGERNTYTVLPRRAVLCLAGDARDLLGQLAAVLATGSRAVWPHSERNRKLAGEMPPRFATRSTWSPRSGGPSAIEFDAVLHHGARRDRMEVLAHVARREGPIVNVHGFAPGEAADAVERLLVERVVSVNTAAAGGNATLMTVG
jgi:RHH-type proline utilization regulon transcriptional repressor/proline dehydrogenase/delta 1-pyrroline-5-carboxylate dehydrogenase